jgi:hypothetical protein
LKSVRKIKRVILTLNARRTTQARNTPVLEA